MSARVLHLGPLAFDIEQFAIQGNAILGIKETGKSYTATMFAEKLMDAGVPITALDPIGIWRFLRVAGKGPGYPVVVAGGENGDLPLTPHGAAEIVRAAMRDGVSIVLDLYSMKLTKSDWRAIVENAVRTMLYENKQYGLRHVFIEEAAEFAPQRVGPEYGKVYAEVEKLARMGGNAGLGYTLISQRAEEVNKAVLELCDALFLFRQKGKNSLLNLGKWLDAAGAEGRVIAATLPTLKQAECWIWPQGAETPIRVPKMPEKRTFHPDRRQMRSADAAVQRKTVDVSAFVRQMSGTLEKVIAEAEANDPRRLKAKIAELERTLKNKGDQTDAEVLRDAENRAFDRGVEEGTRATTAAYAEREHRLREAIRTAAGHLLPMIEAPDGGMPAITVRRPLARVIDAKPRPKPAARVTASRGNGAGEPMPKAERAFLTVLAQRGRPLARNKIAIFAGYSVKSGHIDNTLGALRSKGWARGGNDVISITDDGLAALGAFDDLPTGEELRRYWLGQVDKASRAFLEALFERYPDTLTRDELAEMTGYSPASGHVDNTLGRLRSLELAEGRNDAISAAADLFDAPAGA